MKRINYCKVLLSKVVGEAVPKVIVVTFGTPFSFAMNLILRCIFLCYREKMIKFIQEYLLFCVETINIRKMSNDVIKKEVGIIVV